MDDADDTEGSRADPEPGRNQTSATESDERSPSEGDATRSEPENAATRSEPENADDSTRAGSVAGTLARDQPLEPESIELENAVFVLLGVLLVAALIAAGISGF